MTAPTSSASAHAARTSLRTWFVDRKVATKILTAVGVVALVLLGLTVQNLRQMAAMAAGTQALYEHNTVPISDLAAAQTAFGGARSATFRHIIAATQTELAAQEEAIRDRDAALDEGFGAYISLAEKQAGPHITAAQEALAGYREVRDDRLLPQSRELDTEGAMAAARDADVFSAAADDAFAAMAEIELEAAQVRADESAARFQDARTLSLVLLLAGLAVSIGSAVVVARTITRPLGRVHSVLGRVADGDLTVRADVTSRDEVGQIARSLDVATGNMRTAITSMAGSATTLSSSSEELSAVSGSIAASAEQTSMQSDVVSAAAEQVSRNVQTVATGAEEMGASIREIAQNANEAAQVAASAMQVAETTNSTVGKLGDSSVEIGNVIKVITSIAEQTNLLALNATIEAARAGEAGKGFAVVANEVKDLARETAKATEDIGRRVEAIQADTREAVDAIGEISSIIAQINDYQTTIASAVEEQTATTNEMSRNVAEAAAGSTEIAQNIVGVATAAQTTSAGVTQSRGAAQELAQLSTELERLVGQFRY